MSSSTEFWHQFFTKGIVVFDGEPQRIRSEERDFESLLEHYFKLHTSAISGPPVCFEGGVAVRAAHLVERSAWYLVSRAGTLEQLDKDLVFAGKPVSAAEHLSADLSFQYLPSLHKRARSIEAADRLPAILSEILRRWPLSGVLADLQDAPVTGLEFDSHSGLLLLYAERLAANFKSAWIPRGIGAPYLELVWAELGKDPALLLSSTCYGN